MIRTTHQAINVITSVLTRLTSGETYLTERGPELSPLFNMIADLNKNIREYDEAYMLLRSSMLSQDYATAHKAIATMDDIQRRSQYLLREAREMKKSYLK